MKSLVTGAAGFIGSHLVNKLLNEGTEVIGIDNFYSGKINNLKSAKKSKKFSFLKLDVRNKSIFKINDIDVIFHQAAIAEIPIAFKNPLLVNDVNVNGMLNALELARKTDAKFLFASSSSIYGNTETLPLNEDNIPDPIDMYAMTKFIGEKCCKIFNELYGIETVSLRYFNPYGPRQDNKISDGGVVTIFIKRILRDLLPIIYGNGSQTRDYIFVGDVVEANYLASITDVKGVFNIGTGIPTTVIDLAELIIKILHKNLNVKFSNERSFDVQSNFADTKKAVKELKFTSRTSLNAGLEHTIDYYKTLI